MGDITRANFDEVLPTIKSLLKKADFLSIDTEFTTLVSEETDRASLFDDGRARYDKLRRTASRSLPCQLGLAIFTTESVANKNCYTAHVYNFYLIARAFGPIDPRFILQASSVQFLCNHKFDFNKAFYEGISYMNKEDEAKLLTLIKNNDYFEGLDRDADEFMMQELFTEVVNWLVSAEPNAELQLDLPSGVVSYVIVEEIRLRFSDVWAVSKNAKIVIRKVDASTRTKLEKEETEKSMNQRQEFVNEMLGFTRLVREIVYCRKPLIGHNMFMDLILLYDKFWRSLPVNYRDFKSSVHKLFPSLYDTKHITASMKKELDAMGLRNAYSLNALYEGLTSRKSLQRHLFSPIITVAPEHQNYVQRCSAHEAGYDAYMAGVVFLHLCHHQSMQDVKASEALKIGVREYLANMCAYVNNVNLIRATVNYVSFLSADPVSIRPDWLVVAAKNGTTLNTGELARTFSKYGSVDIKRSGRRLAYVAVGNRGCATDILRASKGHELYTIRRYSFWKHNKPLRTFLWLGLGASSGLCVWTIYKAVTSPS